MFQAQKSTYGTFMKALEGIDLKSLGKIDLDLPKVIVIGNESVGKSSLLENITKCSIFPANHSQCTRAPMRLTLVHVSSPADISISVNHNGESQQLASRDEVLACVTGIMQTVPARSFVSSEIIVKICEVR